MKRSIANLVISAVVLVGFLVLGVQGASAEKKYNLKMGHIQAPGSTMDKQAQKFKEVCETMSNGRLEITIYPASQLGKMPEILDGVSMGMIDLAFETISWLSQFNKDINFFGAPFLTETVEQITEHPHLQEVLDEVRVKNNIRVVALAGVRPKMNLWTKSKPVRTLEELQGVKLRVPPVKAYVDVWNGMGAIAVTIPFSELYMALAQNVVDGMVHNASQIKDQKFDELLKYATILNFKPVINAIMINEQKYQSLPPDLQKILVEATKQSGAYYDQLILTQEKQAWDEMKKAGLQVYEVDRGPWFKKANEVLRKTEENGGWSKGLLDTMN